MSTTIVVLCLLGLAIAIFAVWNSRPVDWTPAEVAQLLRARLRGEQDSNDWDYFVSCRIRDERLEEGREHVLRMEVVGSHYLSGSSENILDLSDAGVSRLEELIAVCETVGRSPYNDDG